MRIHWVDACPRRKARAVSTFCADGPWLTFSLAKSLLFRQRRRLHHHGWLAIAPSRQAEAEAFLRWMVRLHLLLSTQLPQVHHRGYVVYYWHGLRWFVGAVEENEGRHLEGI